MPLRDDLCAQRARTEQLVRELADLEQRCASRNTAHLLCRARGMALGAGEFISQALAQQIDERAPEPVEARS